MDTYTEALESIAKVIRDLQEGEKMKAEIEDGMLFICDESIGGDTNEIGIPIKTILELRNENKQLKHERDKWEMDERICREQLSKALKEVIQYKEALENISKVQGTVDKIECLAAIGYCVKTAQEVLGET
jgi:predicted phage-related endonuclease